MVASSSVSAWARKAPSPDEPLGGDAGPIPVQFERFLRDHLCPNLRPGDIVVWDNHSVHKRPELRTLIGARGAELVWQLRYSPEFNAVEELWSKVKHLVRRARAATQTALVAALAAAVAALTWEDSHDWLCHAGYRLSPIE